MTSQEKLTLVQTTLENTDQHDFEPPQASVDSIRQREKQEMETAQTYTLQQASRTIQTLVPMYDAKGLSYTIRLDTVGSFLKPQPRMLITENPGGRHAAELKLQVHGYDATMIYKNAGTAQKVALRNPHNKEFETSINRQPHRWHPLGPSQSVLELTQEANKRVALFVYAEGMAQRTASTSGYHKPFQEQKIGAVHVIEDFSHEPIALRQIIFSAVVVVEQAKRRATSTASWVAPSPSKTHFPGRRRSKQEGAEEI